MKIIEIIPQLSSGGAERFVVDLCNELVRDRHEVMLVVLHNVDKHGFFRKELHKNVRLVSMNKCMGLDVKLFFRLARLIRKERPDVVHTHLSGIMYSLLAYSRLGNVRFFHTVHSDAAKEAGTGPAKWSRRWAFGRCGVRAVTISEESQRSFRAFYHLPSTMIYNGRPAYGGPTDGMAVEELRALKHQDTSKVIVNVARIAEAKNQLALARAIDRLNRSGEAAVELALIGSVIDEGIREAICRLHSPYVHLLGVRTNPRDYMAAADAFCLPSLYEGMPITLIECFSAGAIPLCTPVGGMINMIHDGENGLLAAGTDQKAIEQLIFRFCRMSADMISEMKRHAKDSFRVYDMRQCAMKYAQLFEQR